MKQTITSKIQVLSPVCSKITTQYKDNGIMYLESIYIIRQKDNNLFKSLPIIERLG